MNSFLRWLVVALAGLLVVAAATDRNLPYASFHALAAGLALLAAVFDRGRLVWVFLVAFGAVDLYQAVASSLHWFPEQWFQWTATDDLVHWVLGALLLLLGGFSRFAPRRVP